MIAEDDKVIKIIQSSTRGLQGFDRLKWQSMNR
jgi:hypothetical protein